jgi:hypothetical protein
MPSDVTSSLARSERLTLGRVMGAIAGLALTFAVLPTPLSVALAVTVLGILVLEGMQLSPVTIRGGAWRWLPWVVWFLALMACPTAIAVIGIVYEHIGPPLFNSPRPWAARVVDSLGLAHFAISFIASLAVVVLTRGALRWAAWAAIVAIGLFAALFSLGAAMSTTGIYL